MPLLPCIVFVLFVCLFFSFDFRSARTNKEKNSGIEAKKLIVGVIRRKNSMKVPVCSVPASGPTLFESLSARLRLVLVWEFCFCSLLFHPVVYV